MDSRSSHACDDVAVRLITCLTFLVPLAFDDDCVTGLVVVLSYAMASIMVCFHNWSQLICFVSGSDEAVIFWCFRWEVIQFGSDLSIHQ